MPEPAHDPMAQLDATEATAQPFAQLADGPAAAAAPAAPPAASPSAPVPAASEAAAASSGAGARKPTKFLADLTKAMQAAAEAERQETLELFQLEAKSHVESIHARSATEAEELRKGADEDISGIRDWSKQEIARIREETENRISSRKTDLTEEIDAHAARIEREIERVHSTVDRFERQMAIFFESLLGETDPTRFAALAANLPEPPAFDAGSDRSVASATFAPPQIPEAQVTEPAPDPEPAVEETAPETQSVDEMRPVDEVQSVDEVPGDLSPSDQEAAFAAIEAAARAAESESSAAPAAETHEAQEAPEGSEPAPEHVGEAEAATTDTSTDDPRLAALGIADFATAEAEASADLPAADDSMPELADETVANRLADLVTDDAETPTASPEPAPTVDLAPPAASAETRAFVSGLISVASIAGFKRHLGRTPGIESVGVTSGPDGEFVFAVVHDPSVDVGAIVTALPGFGARVTESGDGIVRAIAHDPDQA
ncbi:MAG TPA: hypothetical protein VGK63_00800 [Candidatus Limnocylindrales bacterium]